jgi:hypothetical protein
MRSFTAAVSFGVIAINAGTAAIGSKITNSELTASNMYAPRFILSLA